ncbi:hypothetical protein Tco_1371348, partial [Tanacetum coccineum]
MSRQPSRGLPVGLKSKYTFVYRLVSTKNAGKDNGNPKVQMANKATTPILNSFDALNTLVDKEDGGNLMMMKLSFPITGLLDICLRRVNEDSVKMILISMTDTRL